MIPLDTIEAVQAHYEEKLMNIPGVVGIGIGLCNEQPCLKVMVEQQTPELEAKIPNKLEGFPVEIEVTGMFDTFDTFSV